MKRNNSAAITVATVKQVARFVAAVGRWTVYSVNQHLFATDGAHFVQAVRKGRTNPTYSILDDCTLYPVRVGDGFDFVSIPE
jgi:hypothetical protein